MTGYQESANTVIPNGHLCPDHHGPAIRVLCELLNGAILFKKSFHLRIATTPERPNRTLPL
jgi:hypothetical protein